MRLLFIVLSSALLLSLFSCSRPIRYKTYRMLTGTCPGACEYYVMCKERRGDEIRDSLMGACVEECFQVFSSSESLMAFESLLCEDAIAFVEGSNGREPGTSQISEPEVP